MLAYIPWRNRTISWQHFFQLRVCITVPDHNVKYIFQWICGQKFESHWWSLSLGLHPRGPPTFESILELRAHGSPRDSHPPPQLTPKHRCSPKALPAIFSSCGPCSPGGNLICGWNDLKPQQKHFFLLLFLPQAQGSLLDPRIWKAWDL